jgi:hypothetical protein
VKKVLWQWFLVGRIGRLHGEGHLAAVVEVRRRRRHRTARLRRCDKTFLRQQSKLECFSTRVMLQPYSRQTSLKHFPRQNTLAYFRHKVCDAKKSFFQD